MLLILPSRRRADERRNRPLRQRLGRVTHAQPGERCLAQRRKGAEKKRAMRQIKKSREDVRRSLRWLNRPILFLPFASLRLCASLFSIFPASFSLRTLASKPGRRRTGTEKLGHAKPISLRRALRLRRPVLLADIGTMVARRQCLPDRNRSIRWTKPHTCGSGDTATGRSGLGLASGRGDRPRASQRSPTLATRVHLFIVFAKPSCHLPAIP